MGIEGPILNCGSYLRDEENVTLRKDIERLREEAEAIAGDHMMLTEMGARIERLEGENVQKDAEIEKQAAEIEKLRAENAALLQGCDVPQAVLDRIARLERQMAGRDSQLREARVANSALAAENLGIRSRSGRRPREAVEPAPDPFLKVTTMSTHRNHLPISVTVSVFEAESMNLPDGAIFAAKLLSLSKNPSARQSPLSGKP